MDQPTTLSDIRQLIARDELPAAISIMRSLLGNTPKLNEILQQSARLENIRQQIRQGTIFDTDARLEQNRIRFGVLELLSNIEQQGLPPSALGDLLTAVEQESARPELREELQRAISVVNSKNVLIGSNISAGGDIHIGDTITQNIHPSQIHSFNMANQQKAIWLTMLITVLGVVIGFLGELMPEDVKKEIETFVSSFGVSFKTAWYAVTGFVVLLFNWLVWKEASKNEPSPPQSQGGTVRNIHQHGDKSIYIEKNDGPVNIQ